MKTSNAIPGFDALKMKAELQARSYERIKDMTPEEQVAYFNEIGKRPPIWKRTETTTEPTLRQAQRPQRQCECNNAT